MRADDGADPPELDVERLLAEAEAAAMARPDALWAIDVHASGRRRLLARVDVPPLGHAWVGEADAPAVTLEAVEHPVVATDQRLANGLVEVEVG